MGYLCNSLNYLLWTNLAPMMPPITPQTTLNTKSSGISLFLIALDNIIAAITPTSEKNPP